MDVVENVLLAEAMITRTLGTITELKVGILRICPAADLAFVVVALLPPLLLYRLAELDGFRTVAGLELICAAGKIRGEENKQVQHSNNRRQCHAPRTHKDPLHHAESI